MQVAAGGLQGQLGVGHAAQPRGDRRRVDVPHVGVADHRDIGGQLVARGAQERIQADAADLLLALQQHGDARRDRAFLPPGVQRLQERHQLAFVVHRPARDDAPAARPVHQLRLEWRAVPQREGIGRLHVVMAVEQDMRAGIARRPGMMAQHHRMPVGGPHGGLEPQAGQRLPAPLGCGGDVGGVVGLRADAGNAQQVEQPPQRARQPRVHRLQHGWQLIRRRHGMSPAAGGPRPLRAAACHAARRRITQERYRHARFCD